ncbi:esterase/lipase family protein [Vibrio metschnikovii]|uniref:esterase/lipase family protein n=1 Tax=Vibrio metschnikovii TaxID=28172 RepID=UPI001C2FDBF3|nr:alpha/beta hydrolase [Vibrio metschnikovii]
MAELHLMSRYDGDIKTHVVFIHGLGGNHEKTWLSSTPDKGFWPNWLSEEIDNIAIWSVGYLNPISRWGSPKAMHFTDRAKDILHRLSQEPLFRDGEIIFVGHSMGGLMIKQMFHYADRSSEVQSIMRRVTKVSFLATPHRGSSGADLADRLRIIALPSVATASLLKNDPNLRELNEWYRAWVRNRDIDHLILMENQPCKRLLIVVTPDSADPGLNTEALLVDADHLSITKLPNKQSQIYQYIKSFVVKETKPPLLRWLDSKYQEGSNGWQGYSNWSNSPKGVEETYIVDEQVRLFDVSSSDKEGKTGIEAIHSLRSKLGASGSSTRLVGLSGVGKTRLVQALFDDRVGKDQLSADLVLYTDMGHAPVPTPRAVIEKLAAEDKKAIVIIDNCPSELHWDLAPSCKKSISLLTIEYDIREDQPETTGVLSLEPASDTLITNLLKARFTHLSDQDASKIAEFSGGNARIAIALASTVDQSESISHLKDDQLFKRLFHQRHQEEHSLMQAAQVLSLVYSFQYKDDENPYSSELELLSCVSSTPTKTLYESAQELKCRKLIQQRGIWMAVLPHPIANRLAKVAMQNIPTNLFVSFFNENTDRRILASVSRRISYLDNCTEAQGVVARWFKQDGTVGKLLANGKQELALTILTNSAPIAPQETLEFLIKLSENDANFLTRKNPEFSQLADLLRSLAYEPELFPQSTKLLAEIATAEKKDENYNSIRDILKSLFYLYLSGTHASKEQRLNIIKELIESGNECKIEIGFELLNASLEFSHFSSHHSFDFGARSRDDGYHPSSNQECTEWYQFFIEYTESLAKRNDPLHKHARSTLAAHLSELFHSKALWKVLEDAIEVVLSTGEWSEGWLRLGSFLQFNAEGLDNAEIGMIEGILDRLRPTSIDEQIHMYLLSTHYDFYYLDTTGENGDSVNGYEIAEENAEKLGKDLSKSHLQYLVSKLREILSTQGDSSRHHAFGVGCAKGADDHSNFWEMLLDNLSEIPLEKQRINLLRGFIRHLSRIKPELTNSILDSLLHDKRANKWFPEIQFSATLDATAVTRLIQAIEMQQSPIHFYQSLGYGKVHEALSDTDLCKILRQINRQPDGIKVSIEILSMRFHGLRAKSPYTPSNEIKELAQKTLLLADFSKEDFNGHGDHAMHNVAKVALTPPNNYKATRTILERMIEKQPLFSIRYKLQKTLEVVMKSNPKAVLDCLLDEEGNCQERAVTFFKCSQTPSIPLELISEWCGSDPSKRCPIIAEIISPYTQDNEVYRLSKETRYVLEISPNPLDVLKNLNIFRASSARSGSWANILGAYLSIYSDLEEYDDPQVQQWAYLEKASLQARIEAERKREKERDRETDERFE